MDYKRLIIDGYNEQCTTPYISYFKRQAQIAKRDNFVEFADFFNGCKIVVGDWKRSITSWCDNRIKKLDSRINYWQNLFIYDDDEWTKRVKENDGIVDSYSLNKHHEEQRVDRAQRVKELEQEKEEWKYEKHCIEIYLDDYSVKCGEEKRSFFDNAPERQYITLPYNTLVAIENQILHAEQELTTIHNPTPQPEAAEEAKANKVNADKSQRIINAENLKDYFKPTFRGMGNGNINYFDAMIEELKTDRSAKEFAQIAYMIYNSSQLNHRKPNTFATWYRIFCENIGIKRGKYKPNNLKNPGEAINKLFNYL
jgi:hypothetical protein